MEFLGNFRHIEETSHVNIALIDEDKSLTVKIEHDGKIIEEDGAHLQVSRIIFLCYYNNGS